jgi:pimeloyl-ACP methyl ester carboxylesterase
MPLTLANHIHLHHESTGSGEPLVLVHGGWSDLHNWDLVIPSLAESRRVIAYDRRGHGGSDRPGRGTRRDQEDDLAALVEGVAGGPAHLAGTSFGASIALGLASRRPDLVRSVVAHEPPLTALAGDDPSLAVAQASIGAVLDRLAGGDAAGAAEQFVEEVALGPGAWSLLPEPLRATMVDGAPAFAAEQEADPAWASIDEAALVAVELPVLLTQGRASPPWFAPIVARLAELIPSARVATYDAAGHAPHVTHPGDYLATVGAFLDATSAAPAAA